MIAPIIAAVFLSACSITGDRQAFSGARNETLSLAQAAASSGSHAKGAELFEKVLLSDPDNIDALQGAGLSYSHLGQNRRAESVLNRAAELQPRNIDIRNALGRVHLALGEKDLALEDFSKSLRLDGRNVSALTGKAVALDSMSRHSDAQEVYSLALNYYPTNFILRSNFALSLSISGQPEKGIPMLQELVRDPSASEIARGNLALAYGIAGRDADARTTLMLDMKPEQVSENLRVYSSIRGMILRGVPVGALVFG